MKKGLIATALSLGMFLSAKAPSNSENRQINSIDSYKNLEMNYFLETDSMSYNPLDSEDLRKSGINYNLVLSDTVNYMKIPEARNFIRLGEVRQVIDSLYEMSWAPKVVDADLYERFILKESSLDANSYNWGSGASGLSQMREGSWGDVMPLDNYFVERFNPRKSLEAGARYISWLERALPKMNPNWDDLSLEEKRRDIAYSYNWGIGKLAEREWVVEKIPAETRDYAKFVLGRAEI